MQTRARIALDNVTVLGQIPGFAVMSQLQYEANVTIGDSTLTASSLLAGVVNRTGPTGAYNDTLPTVAQLIAACPMLSVGDSFTFLLRNTVAFANTIVAGTGWTLGTNTAIAASLVREFLVNITSTKPTVVVSATTANGTKVLSALSDRDVKALEPGMVISGTGITAGTKIVAVNPDNNTVTTDTNSTADGTVIAITANPTATLQGVLSSTL